MRLVEIYTDGACRGNPGPGGWGVLLRAGTAEKELHGGEAETTNNRMELLAAIEPLMPFDLVISDMAPKTTGIKFADQANSLELCERAFEVAQKYLKKGGHFVDPLAQRPVNQVVDLAERRLDGGGAGR